ncbi:MAG: hypothetical protein WBD22_11240, partial [Pyrinomonadaceae bacterium]
MKTFALLLLFSLIFTVFADDCSTETVRIGVNKEESLTQSKIKIHFIEMVEDSRCPTDVDCIWAGNAKIKINASKQGKTSKIVELNTGQGDNHFKFEGYKIELTDLNPKPASN